MNARQPLTNPRGVFIIRPPLVVIILLAIFVGYYLFFWLLQINDYYLVVRVIWQYGGFVPFVTTAWLTSGDLQAFIVTKSLVSLITYNFMHGSPLHLLANCAFMLVFGIPTAIRFGWMRFLAMFILAGVAGALTYLLFQPNSLIPVVGASGGIAGIFGCLLRFLDNQSFHPISPYAPAISLRESLFGRITGPLIIFWLTLNLILAIIAPFYLVSIAWHAHIGGFIFGWLAFPLFDPQKERTNDNQEVNTN